MQSRRFDFAGSGGQRMSGRLEVGTGPVVAYAIFAHCFNCTKASVAATRVARALADNGFGVLRFDFTGLGDSDGDQADASFSADILDLKSAVRAMQEAGFAPRLLIGHSLGGAAVLAAAAELPEIHAVATIGALFDVNALRQIVGAEGEPSEAMKDVSLGSRSFTLSKSFVEDLTLHDQAQRIRALRRPLLVLHSPQDAIVDIGNASAIFEAARHPKSFISLDGADHLLRDQADAAYAADVIAAWALRYLPPDLPSDVATERGPVIVQETGEGMLQVEASVGGTRFLGDEPRDVGGLGSGLTPFEMVSAGLGACTTMTLRLYANHKQLPLDRITVAVGHAKDAQTREDQFTRRITLDGPLTAEQVGRLLEIAEKCPVHQSLAGSSTVNTVADAHGEPSAAFRDA